MYQGLPQGANQIAQGAALYILYRKDLNVATATVTNISQPHVSKAAQTNPALALQGFVVDLTLNLGNETTTIEFPVNSASANYPEKGWFVSNDRLSVARELDSEMNISKSVLASRQYHEQRMKNGETSLLQINPEKQKEAQQEQEINLLRTKLADMERRASESDAKLDRMLEMLSGGSLRKPKKEE